MKYVFLAIFVLFATQPVQAVTCDMHGDQEMSHSQHGDMQDHDAQSMDCCDHEPADTQDSCDSLSACGAGSASSAATDDMTPSLGFSATTGPFLHAAKIPVFRPHSPPFRPPIA